MPNIFTVSFFGHRWISDLKFVDREIHTLVKTLARIENYVEFLVGRNCDFDVTVSKAINRVQNSLTNNNISHICVLPLPTGTYNDDNYEFYFHCGDVEITYTSIETFSKTAIQIRNMDMVNRSDLCVFYVDREYGIAWQTLQYAKSRHKEILNIADFRTPYNFHPSWLIW